MISGAGHTPPIRKDPASTLIGWLEDRHELDARSPIIGENSGSRHGIWLADAV